MSVKTDVNELYEVKEKKTMKVRLEWRKVMGFAFGLIIPAILLLIWEAAVRFNLLDAYVFPAPTTIVQKIIDLANEGTLWGHVGITFFRVAVGFLAGTVAAVIIGSVVGYFKWFERLMDPLIQAFRSIPSLAWVPLFILWMGIGEVSKVMLIAVGVFSQSI